MCIAMSAHTPCRQKHFQRACSALSHHGTRSDFRRFVYPFRRTAYSRLYYLRNSFMTSVVPPPLLLKSTAIFPILLSLTALKNSNNLSVYSADISQRLSVKMPSEFSLSILYEHSSSCFLAGSSSVISKCFVFSPITTSIPSDTSAPRSVSQLPHRS